MCFFHFIHFLEFIIIPHIPVQFLVLHMVDDVDDIIEERDIMGDQDEGVLILVKIAF